MPDFEMDFGDSMERAFDASEAGTEVAPPSEPEQIDALGAKQAEGADEAATGTNPDQGDEQATEQPADAPAPLEPPARWSADDKAAFAALPREAQDLVLKRERDVESHLSKRTQELSEKDRKFQTLEQVLAPRRPMLQSRGLDEAAVVGDLFNLYDSMQRDPAGFVRWFASQSKVDLASLDSADEGDPEINAIRNELHQLKGMQTHAQQEQQRAVMRQASDFVQAFKSEAGEDGQPLRPHFDALESHMAALIKDGVAKDLQEAYDQAVWANPETRSALMEAQKQAEQTKREAEAKAKAAAAEKAAGTRPRSSNGQFVSSPGKTWDDTMSAVFDAQNG